VPSVTIRAGDDGNRAAPRSGSGAEELTIDELAQQAGTTVRNVRAHQSRGLLQPPEIRGRTGYYGPHHRARLELIRDMQADGFNLKAIKRLLERARGAEPEILGLGRSMMAPFGAEPPEYLDRDGVLDRFGTLDPRLMARARKLGLIVKLSEDRFELPNPALARAGEQVIAMGVPLDHLLAVAEQIIRSSRTVAEAFTRLFLRDVLGPRHEGDASPERLSELRAAVEQLRPIASEALLAGFQQEMTRSAERAFGARFIGH
jgi:DNA-binding transcriptional MerR regulator